MKGSVINISRVLYNLIFFFRYKIFVYLQSKSPSKKGMENWALFPTPHLVGSNSYILLGFFVRLKIVK